MDTPEKIITALEECSYPELMQIRQVLDARADGLRNAFMAQAEAMGFSCRDDNGKPRKRRTTKSEDTA